MSVEDNSTSKRPPRGAETLMSFIQDPLRDRMREGVALRNQVHNLAAWNIEQAYKIAASIEHPWYRCQALAEVSDYSDKATIKAFLGESFESAMRCHDQNRRVSVACWPLGVALKNDLQDLCQLFLDGCIEQINQNMDPLSKWCAVSVVYTIKKDHDLLKKFYATFAKATSQGHGWRVERDIRYMLSDPDIQKDRRYIAHLLGRQLAIINWKKAHAHRNDV